MCGLREPRIVVGVFVLLFRNLVLLKNLLLVFALLWKDRAPH